MIRLPALTTLAALIAALGCDPPSDIGSVCALPSPSVDGGLWLTTSTTDDIFSNGAAECIGQVCLRPKGSPLDAGLGFCTDTCTPTSPGNPDSPASECSGGSVPVSGPQGITLVAPVCRSVALDQNFINGILDAGGAALLEKYLGGTQAPVYCTTP